MSRFSRVEYEAKLALRALAEPEFRQRLLDSPRTTYEEGLAGARIPEGVELRVVEERPNLFYVVVPYLPQGDWNAEALRAVAERTLTHREPCWGLGDPPELADGSE